MPELKLTVAVDLDEVRTWAEKHSDAGHNSVATILFRFLDNPEQFAVDAAPSVPAVKVKEVMDEMKADRAETLTTVAGRARFDALTTYLNILNGLFPDVEQRSIIVGSESQSVNPASFYVDSRTAWKELPTGSVVSSADGLRTRIDTGWSVDGEYEHLPEGLFGPISIVSIPGEVG